MFTIDKKNKITIVQGDTLILDLVLDNYNFVQEDKVYLTVKNSVYDTENLIQEIVTKFEGNKARIMLTKDQTNVEVGAYVYDIQCSLNGNIVDTVIPLASFEVIGGITND